MLTASRLCHDGDRIRNDIFVSLAGFADNYACEVSWISHHDPVDAGIALLAIVDPAWPHLPPPTPRWGQFTGYGSWLSCEAGVPSAAAYPSQPVTGRISPFSSTVTGLLDFELADWEPSGEQASDMLAGRPSLAGASVLYNGLIVGVMPTGVSDDTPGSAPVIPAARLISDESFARQITAATMQAPRAESLELSPVLAPWPAPPPQTTADLLRPELATVRFTGRRQELDDLVAWCNTPAMSAACLVVGNRGAGTTRLAREVSARMHADGWVTGFVTHLNAATHEALAQVSQPVLLIIDDAEAQSDISSLITHIATRPPWPPVRCLVLAHDMSGWWTRLTASAPEVSATFSRSPMLLSASALHADSAADAARDLANGLSRLPGYASTDWAARITRAARRGDHGAADTCGALEAILAALLADEDPAIGSAADVPLAREAHLPDAVADHFDLDPTEVRDAARVAAAELVLARQLGALGRLEPAIEAAAEAVRILRAEASDGHLTRTLAFAMSSSYLAGILTATGQYEDGLMHAGEALEVFRQLDADRPECPAPEMADALLSMSECQARLGLAAQARSCAEEAVALHRLLAETEPAEFQGPLAEALCVLTTRLEEARQWALANYQRAEAVELYQNLTGTAARKYQHALIMALCEHARGLARSGSDGSVAFATEAVRRAGEPGADGDTTILPLDEAEALATLAECLRVRRKWVASRAAARNAAGSCLRDVQFSIAEPTFGANARMHLADRLCALSRRLYDLDALSASLEVVELAERLCDSIDDPPADVRYGLARSLELSSVVLRELPRRRDAARAAEEAVALYRGLATEDPVQFLGQLARALGTLARTQRPAEAKRLRGEAAAIWNEPLGGTGRMDEIGAPPYEC